jgi:hypothetical protein
MKDKRTIVTVMLTACMLALALTYTACQDSDHQARPASAHRPVSLMTLAPSTSRPAGPSSVLVYIKMNTEKKYGLVAHVGGKRDITQRSVPYAIENDWWDNPLVVYADSPFTRADVIGRADAETITGRGSSKNVGLRVTLVPHADVAMQTMPASDAVKGTITVTISTVADYFDGGWTEMVRATDKRLTFTFNTCDPGKRVQETAHEARSVPAFSLERYTREHEKWEPRSSWPDQPESGDWRSAIYGKDAVLDVTGYRYVQR